ncbi:MAG: lysophospholipid acyltransferase family protein [Pikeienuella sp.]
MARLGATYIRLVLATVRWEIRDKAHFDAEVARGGGLIAAIWHGRLFLSPSWAPPGRETLAVISNNADGELISAIVARFGVASIRGSTYDKIKRRNKGGAEVTRAALDGLARGAVVAITPDGPRGPRMRAQAGVARLAVSTGAAVVPISFSARRAWLAPSWDRFLVPWPFTRGIQAYGPALVPPPDGDAEAEAQFCREIEAALTALTQEADRLCGRVPVEPAPADDLDAAAAGERPD